MFIDIDAKCPPEECPFARERFDVLPLLRLIWSNPGLEHKIRLLERGKYLNRDLHHGSDDSDDDDSDSDSNDNTSSDDIGDDQHSETPDADAGVGDADARLHERAKLLDNLLVNLSTHGLLNLKPYLCFGRLLKEVYTPLLNPGEVAQVDAGVDVLFDCSGEEYWRERIVPYDGTAASLYNDGCSELGGRRKLLRDLPSHILHRVYEYVTATPPVVIFGLDSRSVTGIDLGPL